MGETIQSFVAKLQTEGVDAGKQAAGKLTAAAEAKAEQTVAEARQQAQKIVDQARQEAKGILDRAQTELGLACRDALLRLRQALGKALGDLVRQSASQKLGDIDFVGKILHEIIVAYTKSELSSGSQLQINVQPEMRDKLVAWAMKELGQQVVESHRSSMQLHSTLSQAGFEYSINGSTVEVTLDSVAATLGELVNPALREVIEKSMSQAKSANAQA